MTEPEPTAPPPPPNADPTLPPAADSVTLAGAAPPVGTTAEAPPPPRLAESVHGHGFAHDPDRYVVRHALELAPPSDPLFSRPPRWKVSFADFCSVLICFFVLVFAATVLDKEEFLAITKPFTTKEEKPFIDTFTLERTIRIFRPSGANLDYLSKVVDATFAPSPNLRPLAPKPVDGRLVIPLPYEKIFTDRGALQLATQGSLVDDLAASLSHLNNQIQIQTLGVDPSRSGLTIAAALERAHILAQALRASGYPREITTTAGFAEEGNTDTRYIAVVVLPTAYRLTE